MTCSRVQGGWWWSNGVLFLMREVPLLGCCFLCARYRLMQVRGGLLVVEAVKPGGPCDRAGYFFRLLFDHPIFYRGTSLIRNCLLLGPYSRAVPMVLWWS